MVPFSAVKPSNRRLVFVASGMGAQLAAYLFRVDR
jgi:hypothetical protein